MTDPWNDPAMQAWLKDALDNLVPKMANSSVVVSLVPTGVTDIKFAVETGLALMLDKPIVLMVGPGASVPAKLAKVADAIVEYGDLSDPGTAERLTAVVRSISDGMADDDNVE